MDRSKLKTYAPQARRDFIAAMKSRAALFGVTEKGIAPATVQGDVVLIQGHVYPRAVEEQRQCLTVLIEREGFETVMEAMAYTWFNRFAALRYMELHGYLDHGYRVLSHPEGKLVPEILEQAEHVDLPGLKPSESVDLKLEGKEQELYRRLLVAQCNALHQVMPFLFETIADETELLLPDNLLHSDSLIRKLVDNLGPEDCENVEVLGWLYQFYIAEKKDAVMARKSAVPTEDIPAVTQLFTPHWVVRYLVENSLGRLWLLNRPGSRLKEHMLYYIEGESESHFLEIDKPEDIRILDPACGSGHMLLYAFDLLVLIYEEAGYAPNDIPALVLKHNLQGLDICPRAAQLAGLALAFKAREKSRRFLQIGRIVQPAILELQNVRFADNELRDYIQALGLGDLFNEPMLKLLHQFEEAKTFGSLIQPCLDEQGIAFVRSAIDAKGIGGQLFLRETHLKILRVLKQAEALIERYHVVVANPPYMGAKGMNASMREIGKSLYPKSKVDLFSMFIERAGLLVLPQGWTAMVTMQSWMFLSSYHALRISLLEKQHLKTLIQIGYNSFPELNSKVAQACAFVIENARRDTRAACINLNDAPQFADKDLIFISKLYKNSIFRVKQSNFSKIPGSPIAYWVTDKVFEIFDIAHSFDDQVAIKNGMSTTDNDKFTRLWHEVGITDIGLRLKSADMASKSHKRWFPYNKGGEYRRWYGNMGRIVNWCDNGSDVKHAAEGASGGRIVSEEYFFMPSISWTKVSSGQFAVRYYDPGFIFDVAGPSIFCSESETLFYCALLNSRINHPCLQQLSPTINYEAGQVGAFPILNIKDCVETVSDNAMQNIAAARSDWDNFETSWDFCEHPMLRPGLKGATMEASWRNWVTQSNAAIHRMQYLETENNRLFIEAYGLRDELTPEVPEDQITLARADAPKDTAAILSYALGCMMGRYSLDKPGLVYAHAGNVDFDPSQYTTFLADEDGIVPVTEFAWFPDDAALRFEAFMKTAWSPETLEENLAWVAENLSPRNAETPRETIRRYFATGLYKDHLQTYKKRPIYWLFSSGKERAFQALVYLHRYHEGTLARMRTEYVIPLQGRIASRIEQLQDDITRATSTAHSRKLQKEMDTLKKHQVELHGFDEKLRHHADLRISLDLDDGVKVNYGKFGDLLANLKDVTGGSGDD